MKEKTESPPWYREGSPRYDKEADEIMRMERVRLGEKPKEEKRIKRKMRLGGMEIRGIEDNLRAHKRLLKWKEPKNRMQCKMCGRFHVRTSANQKYCPECQVVDNRIRNRLRQRKLSAMRKSME